MKLIIPCFCLLLLSQFSYSQQWVRQNPFPFLSQMHDIDFDGQYGLAVGADGAIFTTINGGRTWKLEKAPPQAKTLTTAYVLPGTSGQIMMAGGDDLLLITKDGGKYWYITHDYIPNLYKIQSFSDDQYVALGSNFGLRSSDGGLIWFAFNMPQTSMGVTAGHFTSFMNGWVSYGDLNNQQVWVTTDGGMSWNVRDTLKHSLIVTIDMLDDENGFLASRDFVYQTSDGGNHWLQLHPIAPEAGISDMHVAGQFDLWASLNDGNVYYSKDGGQIWHEVNPNLINSNKTLGIWANTQGEAWTVGKYISILHTTDYGATWTDQIPAEKETMFEPNFFDEFIGMVGGSDGTILRTKNSGAKWEAVKFPRVENFYGMKMIDDKVVIAGSVSGKVFLSEDQGDHWTTIGQNLGEITDLEAFNRQEIIITSKPGKIYKTTDGGGQWSKVYNNPNDTLFALDFLDNQHGWAAGWNGKIAMTTDGGDTWNQIYDEGRNHFSDIHFTTETEGWVVSSSNTDTIWHTTDGGLSWLKSPLPVKTNWRAISFKDATTGWIDGGSDGYGVVLRTDNGGDGWYITHESPDALLGIYAVPGQETVWATGFGGNIVKYDNCTLSPRVTEIRGNLEPCANDTVNFVVDFSGVDIFDWSFPADWFVEGNSNTSSVHFVVGDSTGVVSVRGRDACGDSTELISVNVIPVIPPEVTLTLDNGNLVSNITSGIFEWLLNGVPVPGAENFIFHPLVNGTYQLHLTTFTAGCEAYSNPITVFVTGIKPYVGNDFFEVYPNPAKDFVYVKFKDGNSPPADTKITLINVDGKSIQTHTAGRDQISLEGIPPGIYIIQVQSGGQLFLKKIMIE